MQTWSACCDDLTLTSAGLAVIALVGVVLIGLLVARRTARDSRSAGRRLARRRARRSRSPGAGALRGRGRRGRRRVQLHDGGPPGLEGAAGDRRADSPRGRRSRAGSRTRSRSSDADPDGDGHPAQNLGGRSTRRSTRILEESTATVMEEADRLKHIVSEFSAFATDAQARVPAPRSQRARALGARALPGRGPRPSRSGCSNSCRRSMLTRTS